MSLTVGQRARLGVFMLVGVALLAVFTAIPVGLRIAEHKNSFVTYFEGESLSGLENGATVKYRGIPIGKVNKIAYDPKNLSRVKVTLSVDGDFPMKVDMVAEAGLMGITGLKYVEIDGGGDTSALLLDGGEIPSRRSLMASITGKTEVIIAKVELLLNHLNAITAPESLVTVKKILANVESVSATADQFATDMSPEIKELAVSFRKTALRMDSITADIHQMTRTVSSGIDAERFTTIVNRVDTMALSLKNLSESLDLTIRQSREDVTVSMENLRETLENANELSKMLMENPSLIIKGDNPRERSDR